MNAFNKKFLFSGFLLLLVILSGCTGVETPAPTASPTVKLIPTATASPPTPTATTVPTATASPTNTPESGAQAAATSGDRAAFVSETYPDNSVLEVGESFTKAFELRNAGSTTWTTDYALVRDETDPAGETLASAERLALPQAVGPGETLMLELPLTAPEEPGTYTVYWTLQDANGAVVPVDGVQRVWATIRVQKEGQIVNPSYLPWIGDSPEDITFEYVRVFHEEGVFKVEYCMTVANPAFLQYGPAPMSQSLIIDSEILQILRGGFARPVYDPIPGYNCFAFELPVDSNTLDQAQSAFLRIGKVEAFTDPYDRCVELESALEAYYPGMKIECDPSGHNPYTSLIPPAGMSKDEAHQIFMDAINSAVYGPWDVTIK